MVPEEIPPHHRLLLSGLSFTFCGNMMEQTERFETEPVIDCGDVVLRRFRMDDIDDIVEHINDRGISRYTLNIPYPYGPEDAIEFLE
ncbi:MAG: GNAT family N-acetyltransferase, partial [Thermoplasmatota archaeon]